MLFIRALQGCFIGVSIKLQECYKSDTWVLQVCYLSVTRLLHGCFKSVTRVTGQELQLKSGMSRVTSYDQLRLTNKICYLIPTCLDLQILARKLLPVATIVRLAIFLVMPPLYVCC